MSAAASRNSSLKGTGTVYQTAVAAVCSGHARATDRPGTASVLYQLNR